MIIYDHIIIYLSMFTFTKKKNSKKAFI